MIPVLPPDIGDPMAEENELPEEEDEKEAAVDTVAREEIRKLRERFEGGSLVPSFSVLLRTMLNSIVNWSGWEIVFVSFAFLLTVGLILGIIVFTAHGCNSYGQEMEFERDTHIREQYSPICEAFGLQFVSMQSIQLVDSNGAEQCTGDDCARIVETVVCAGPDRVVTINARNTSQSTIHMLE